MQVVFWWFIAKCQPCVVNLQVQYTHFGYSFAFDASTLWNALLDGVQTAPFVVMFRRRLKTYLYNKVYPKGIYSF